MPSPLAIDIAEAIADRLDLHHHTTRMTSIIDARLQVHAEGVLGDPVAVADQVVSDAAARGGDEDEVRG